MRFKEFQPTLSEMAANLGGLEYEKTVVSTVQHAISNFSDQVKFQKLDCGSAGFCRFSVDLELMVGQHPFNIEIKQNTKAQMGGTSVKYQDDKASLVDIDRIDQVAASLIIEAVQSKGKAIHDLFDFIAKQEPTEVNGLVAKKRSIPLVCTKDAWTATQQAGLLVPLNGKVNFNHVDAITRGYNKKDIFYIQIGGAGLFYMNKNPLNLPVPKFDGSCNIEIRLGRSGSKVLKSGVEVVSGAFRAQARLITKSSSPYSLDNPEQAEQILKIALDNQ